MFSELQERSREEWEAMQGTGARNDTLPAHTLTLFLSVGFHIDVEFCATFRLPVAMESISREELLSSD